MSEIDLKYSQYCRVNIGFLALFGFLFSLDFVCIVIVMNIFVKSGRCILYAIAIDITSEPNGTIRIGVHHGSHLNHSATWAVDK